MLRSVVVALVALVLACGPSSGDAPAPTAPAAPAAPIPAPTARCGTRAYVSDPDPGGLKIRVAPSGKAQVLDTLPLGTVVRLTDASGGWLHATGASNPEIEGRSWPAGWVHGSLLTTDLKFPSEYGPDARPVLVGRPDPNGPSRGIPERPWTVSVLGCSDEWLEVKLEGEGVPLTGWLSPGDHCPNPVTTCP